eukprot:TRINITY_DN13658_c0_g1_i1.p1 TRINITY_DN13658_c0_g1~~TRINITY_DN13658_c0_g1_i1.p1  ORF type:complete len:118 (-),score=25.06 TRINITY_DN13658_c0_g1_i1:37-369(-)
MEILNFNDNIDVRDLDEELGVGGEAGLVHIRAQQRNARKWITSCAGLDQSLNFKRVLRALRKLNSCNGNIVKDKNLGNILQLQGDHRHDIYDFLVATKLVPAEKITIHGT